MDSVAERLLSLVDDPSAFAVSQPRPFCVVLGPREPTSRDFLHEDLLTPEHREAFFSVVDEVGLVVVRGVNADPSRYRDVRGRSSRGRLSQGEYYHHDGCSGPTKPRVVEIRCPVQPVPRTIATAVAPFPETLYAMLRQLPEPLAAREELAPWCEQLAAEGQLPEIELDMVQGLATRAVRKSLGAADARAYFRHVDARCNAFDEPWERGESRFIGNANSIRTMQHRRAYAKNPDEIGPSGKLLKRWPADDGVLD